MDKTPTFPEVLEGYREGRLSRKQLALRIGLSPAMITLFLSGQRRPNRSQTLRMAAALELTPAETDDLLLAAGHLPTVYDRTSPADRDLMLVADVLGDAAVPESAKLRLRLAIRLASLDWRPDTLDLGPLHAQLAGRPSRPLAVRPEA